MVSEALPADGRPLSTPAMLLAVDIGNTNVVFGVFDGTGWRHHWRVRTVREKMADEYGVLFRGLLGERGLAMRDFERIVIASVVPPLVMQAVEAAQAEQFLLIRVHPDARAGVEAGLGAVRQAHPAVGVIELVDDESLDPLSCVVVSEAGEVRAGVAQQIEAIRAALAGASGGAPA